MEMVKHRIETTVNVKKCMIKSMKRNKSAGKSISADGSEKKQRDL